MKTSLPIFILLVLLLTACGAVVNDPLVGDWKLVDLQGAEPIAGSQITLQFDNGSMRGTAGCNEYSGKYTLKGDQITFEMGAMTEMACLEPEDLMNQESAYTEILGKVARYLLRDNQLVLLNVLDEEVLIFSKP